MQATPTTPPSALPPDELLAHFTSLLDPIAWLKALPFWFLVVGTVIASLLAWHALRRMRQCWLSAREVRSALKGMAQGMAVVEGKAAALGEPPRATLSGKPCIWDHWQVETWRRLRRGGDWQPHESGAGTAPFLLRATRGAQETVLVLPEGAVPVALTARSWEGRTERPGESARILQRLGRMLAGTAFRYTETRVRPGQPIFVLGTPEPRTAEDPPDVRRRIAAGEGSFLIGGEPPRRLARRWRRRAEKNAVAAVLICTLMAAVWLLRLW